MEKFKAGDCVNYRRNGICKVVRITKRDFGTLGETEYYELSPVYDPKTVIYVPTEALTLTQGMRRLLSAEEIDRIIEEAEGGEFCRIEDAKKRSAVYGDIISEGDPGKILRLVKELSLYRISAEKEKKKFYVSDAKLLAAAEKAIFEEFAYVLGIERDEVIPYIMNKVESVGKT